MTETGRRLLRTPQGTIGLVLLLIVALTCVFGPVLAPYDPEAIDFMGRYAPPSARHWLGGDQLGRDVFSRLLWGARTTIPLALLSAPGLRRREAARADRHRLRDPAGAADPRRAHHGARRDHRRAPTRAH